MNSTLFKMVFLYKACPQLFPSSVLNTGTKKTFTPRWKQMIWNQLLTCYKKKKKSSYPVIIILQKENQRKENMLALQRIMNFS